MIQSIYDPNSASVCFFRTTVHPPDVKILLQITERCNLRCSHCFVDSENMGNELSLREVEEHIIPNFLRSNVTKVTLTGGEPLFHNEIKEILDLFCKSNISVSICTNASLVNEGLLNCISNYNNIHFNVSLDGLHYKSHGRFRNGMTASMFETIMSNIRLLGKMNLLNGILTTPNTYSSIEEYVELCHFARDSGARYVLMNPLSPFGRGQKTQPLAFGEDEMIQLKNKTIHLITESFDVVYIRFPNDQKLHLGNCLLGSIPYVFTNGDIAICPYMVFASNNEDNLYNPQQFMIGNIFEDINIKSAVANYRLPTVECATIKDLSNSTCLFCSRGCYASKISNNQALTDCESNLCPLS